MAGSVFHGAGPPVTGDGTVDDSPVDFLEGIIVKAHLLHNSRAKLVDHHVSFGNQLAEYLLAGFLFKIQGDTFFIAVNGGKTGTLTFDTGGKGAPQVTTTGILYFDHFCPEIGQDLGAEGTGQVSGQV